MKRFGIAAIAALLAACSVNPVTGQRQFNLVSTRQEVRIGNEQYAPAIQMQGGKYYVDPAVIAYVQRVGQRLARVSDRPDLPYQFTVLNNDVPNAWALPGGKIAINRGLLTELHSEAELAAVLGHEIVHAAAGHGAQAMSRGMLLQLGLATVALGASDEKNGLLVVGGAQLGAALLSQKYSREDESEADKYGMIYMKRAGYDPAAAVDLQRTFVKISRENGGNGGWLQGLFASHPPSEDRVRANQKTLQQLGAGGETGRDAYRQAMSLVFRDQSAYADYNKGREALNNKQYARAADLAHRAIRAEPREGKFYALLGDIDYAKQNFSAAETQYRAALQRYDAYFAFHLGAGLAARKTGHTARAGQELKAANRLLETALAHEVLGEIDLAAGRREAAIAHFQVAAQSDSYAGRAARQHLAQLGVKEQG